MIASSYSSHPGKWDNRDFPYQIEPMNAFTQPGVEKIVLMWAAQLGKSEILLNVILRYMDIDPCPTLLVEPDITSAKSFSQERLSPTIERIPQIDKMINSSKQRTSDNRLLEKNYPGGFLVLVGPNSPSGLAQRSIRLLLMDEVGRYKETTGIEGDPVGLAMARTVTFWNKKIGLFSSPTLPGSTIDVYYQSGTQEEWQHKCPNCGTFCWITMDDIVYDMKTIEVGESTVYDVGKVFWRCPHCGFKFSESEMKNAEQKYVVLNPAALKMGVRSFHVNIFANPTISWKDTVMQYLSDKDDPEKLKRFVNTKLGESFKPKQLVGRVDELMDRREDYGAQLPEGVLILIASVDVQDNRLEYEIDGWGVDEECWCIKKDIVLGSPGDEETWQLLDRHIDAAFSFADGTSLSTAITFIDSQGHFAQEVYAYCYKNRTKQRYAIKGSNIYGEPLLAKIGKPKGFRDLPLLYIGVDNAKQNMFYRLLKIIPEKGKRTPKSIHFPIAESAGFDIHYFRGLLSEEYKPVKKNGETVYRWLKTGERRNEPLDLRCYNFAALKYIVDYLKIDWKVYERAVMDARDRRLHNSKEVINGQTKRNKPSFGTISAF